MPGSREDIATETHPYSATRSCLHRAAALNYPEQDQVQRRDEDEVHEFDVEETILVHGSRQCLGRCHYPEEATYARTIADDLGESRGIARQLRHLETDMRTRSTVPQPLLSVDEAAILLGQSRASLYRSIDRGDLPLPVFKINGRLRIARRAVERLLEGEPPINGGGGVPPTENDAAVVSLSGPHQLETEP